MYNEMIPVYLSNSYLPFLLYTLTSHKIFSNFSVAYFFTIFNIHLFTQFCISVLCELVCIYLCAQLYMWHIWSLEDKLWELVLSGIM